MSLKWVDVLEIAIQLAESKPDVDPRYVNFVDLHRWVLALPEFSDDPSRGGEKVLEAIQPPGSTKPTEGAAHQSRVPICHEPAYNSRVLSLGELSKISPGEFSSRRPCRSRAGFAAFALRARHAANPRIAGAPGHARGFLALPTLLFGVISMALQRTFSIIKPDAVSKNVIGEILTRFEKAGLRVVASKMVQLSEREAGGFYAEHKERPFFKDLVSFMTSGPVVVQVLEGEDAILRNRELMGATDPKKADAGTIRADFAVSIDENAVHGSDSEASAAREIAYFFSSTEVCERIR